MLRKVIFFQLEEDIYICFIYIPPVNSTFTNSQDNNSFELLEMMSANSNLKKGLY